MGFSVIDSVKACVDGALPVLSAMCEKTGLIELIDCKVGKQGNRIVSSGNAIKAMMMNIVSGRKPLYRLESFYEKADTEKLFGEGVTPEHLNDDTMARALDDLYEVGAKKVMTELAMLIIKRFDIPVTSIHADTTSKSVYGEYEACEYDDKLLQIKRGYNKDHRPDLKQLLFGLGVTKDRIIVAGDVTDGNTSDKEWNKDILKELRKSMKEYGLRDFIYVADSAAVTEEMLKGLSGDGETEVEIPFVTRLPGTYHLEKELRQKAAANKDKWIDAGKFSEKDGAASYKIQAFTDKLYDKEYHFVVCSSDHLDTRKQKKLRKLIDEEKDFITSTAKKFEKQEFYCQADAEESFRRIIKQANIKYHEVSLKIEAKEQFKKKQGRGRCSKYDVREKETLYLPNVSIYEDEASIEELKDEIGMFVLVTSAIEQLNIEPADVLKEYKEQTSVETSFRVLKDPLFIDELFVKTPQRVEALGYVMLMALMLLTLLERTVRVNLKNSKEGDGRVKIIGQVYTDKPTGKGIIDTFENITVIAIFDSESNQWHRKCNIDGHSLRLLKLAGFDETVYTKSTKTLN